MHELQYVILLRLTRNERLPSPLDVENRIGRQPLGDRRRLPNCRRAYCEARDEYRDAGIASLPKNIRSDGVHTRLLRPAAALAAF
jgi:hypothetical protein